MFTERFNELLKSRGINAITLAKEIGVPKSIVYEWRSGVRDPSLENMLRIADILQSRHEKVIFATSTPVSEKNMYNRNTDIKRYNDLIVPLLRERGIIINDLYSAVIADVDRYISDDMIHLSEDGITLCSRMVADVIRDTAASLSDTAAASKKADLGGDGAPVIFG